MSQQEIPDGDFIEEFDSLLSTIRENNKKPTLVEADVKTIESNRPSLAKANSGNMSSSDLAALAQDHDSKLNLTPEQRKERVKGNIMAQRAISKVAKESESEDYVVLSAHDESINSIKQACVENGWDFTDKGNRRYEAKLKNRVVAMAIDINGHMTNCRFAQYLPNVNSIYALAQGELNNIDYPANDLDANMNESSFEDFLVDFLDQAIDGDWDRGTVDEEDINTMFLTRNRWSITVSYDPEAKSLIFNDPNHPKAKWARVATTVFNSLECYKFLEKFGTNGKNQNIEDLLVQ